MTAPAAPDPQAIRAARAFLARISGRYPVVQALLYGSRARGDARADSDVDIAVVLEGPKGRAVQVGPDMVGEGYDVILESGFLISPLPIWEVDWLDPDRHSNPWLVRTIKREGVAI